MNAPVVIIGAGIAGVATAFQLTELGVHDVVVCDPRAPLTLTSDKSTECYRNWWPSAEMVSFMNRSIDLLETYDVRSRRAFNLNRRGYLYVTNDENRLGELVDEGRMAESHGAGELRRHSSPGSYRSHTAGGVPAVDGADLLDGASLARHFPHITSEAIGALHVRRAGWMSAQQLGAWMLEEARRGGARLVAAAVERIEIASSAVKGVVLSDGSRIRTSSVVDAAGPLLGRVAALGGVELPVQSEAHFKVAFRDSRRTVPRNAPMMIWCDPQRLEWSDDERRALTETGRHDLTDEMPSFCHGRPEGPEDSPWIVALWEYHRAVLEPIWPMPGDDLYPEVVLRGMSRMIPALGDYLDHMPQPFVDGGYYTKAPDNLPLVGPTDVDGMYVCGGLSGYGIMASAAAGELAASWVAGQSLPEYEWAFRPSRFEDPRYLASARDSAAGQL